MRKEITQQIEEGEEGYKDFKVGGSEITEEQIRKILDDLISENTKRESQLLEREILKRRRLHAETTILEFMLQQDSLKELIDKDLLKELKEASVMLMGFTEGDTSGYEQRCKEDPFWGPMQEASAFGKGHNVRELEKDPNKPFANEPDAEYFKRITPNSNQRCHENRNRHRPT
jgi:hypothetical protein